MTQQSHFFQAWPPIDARRLPICPNGRQFADWRRNLWQEKTPYASQVAGPRMAAIWQMN
ncbi:hypothetical protein ACGFZ6_12455 [Stutzerimonas stutzeri]|uniref:hypothetical protein n=1 Tax=Stutzerimonas stutzeri TaxID=316 RepID=UPI00371DA70C